jgi:hypothetical protein
MKPIHPRRVWPVALLAATACIPDSVSPGDYGADEDGGEASTSSASSGGTSPEPAPSSGGDGGTATSRGGEAAPGAADAGTKTTGSAATSGCDLTGRWLATDREVADGLGAQEAAHTWLYYEISQTGSALTVTKGLNCGQNVVGISAASADVDYPKTWPAMQTKATQTGRKGTSASSSSGCAISFDKMYTVLGATVSTYLDPSTTMPTVSQEATATSPGWEDWDNDGNPGFTMNVSGLATGQIYIATRAWNEFSGTIAAGSTNFTLADNWDSDQDLLGYSGSSLLTATTSGTRDNDDSLHFVTFARLDATQATGTDDAICAAIRMLAPGLTPKASN